jgi:hypothetical protein
MVGAVMIVLLGLALRLYQLDYSFEGDELFSVSVTRGSLALAVDAALGDRPHPPLYYLTLWAWLRVAPPTESGARLLSVVASAAFLVALWRISARLLRPGAALFVLLLGATSPFFVHYGQQARMYSLIAALTVLSVLLLLRLLDEPDSWSRALIWGVSCTALQWSQYVAALVILPQLAAICRVASPNRPRLLAVGALAMASVLPWFVAARLARPVTVDVGLPAWMDRPGLSGPLDFLVEVFGLLSFRGSTRLLILLGALATVGLLFRSPAIGRRFLPLTLALVALPTAGLFLVSELGPVPLWAPRQLIGSAAFGLLLLGMALDAHRRWLAVFLGICFVSWVAAALPDQLPARTKPPWRALASRLDRDSSGSPIIAAEDWVIRPLGYYSRRTDLFLTSDFPAGQCCGSANVILVCRPKRCAPLRDLRERYDFELRDAVTWTVAPKPTSTLEVYVLRERK